MLATFKCNIVHNMLHMFAHPIHVACGWLKFEYGQIFLATLLDLAWCCTSLFGQARATLLHRGMHSSLVVPSNMLQHGGEMCAACCT